MRKLLLAAAAFFFGFTLVAAESKNSSLAAGYSVHVGAQQFLLARANLEKSRILAGLVFNPFLSSSDPCTGVHHVFVEGLPDEFIHVYRYLTEGRIDAETNLELEQLRQSAKRYQIDELEKCCCAWLNPKNPSMNTSLQSGYDAKKQAAVLSQKTDPEDKYIWVKSVKIIRFAWKDGDRWASNELNNLGDLIAHEFEDKTNITTVRVKNLGSYYGGKLLLVVNKEKWPDASDSIPKKWKKKTLLFEQPATTGHYESLWGQNQIDDANKRLDELFKDATKKRLLKIEPMGFTQSNSLLLLLIYEMTQ